MKTTEKKFYLTALETAQEKFDKEVEGIADKLRLDVIIPVCKKHNLKFTSGNGRFWFTTQDDKFDYHEGGVSDRGAWMYKNIKASAVRAIQKDLTPIFELLNSEVSHGQYLGYYVSDIKKEDCT